MNKEKRELKNIQKLDRVFSAKDLFVLEKLSNLPSFKSRDYSLEQGASLTYLLIIDKAEAEDLEFNWLLKENSSLRLFYLYPRLEADFNLKLSTQVQILESAKLESRSLILAQAKASLDLKADYFFLARKSLGNIYYQAILEDEAKVDIDANIRVLSGASLSESRIDLNVFLDDKASSKLIPGLDVEQDDVKAAHAASTWRIDKEDLFYLNSRGLSEERIREIIKNSLLENFIKHLNSKEASEEIKKFF